jgi:hypothetical protein
MWIVTLGAVALLARRNLRLGRGDRRGAIRVAAFVLVAGAVASVVGRHWTFDSAWIWTVISTHQGRVLFSVALVWLSYLGLEPYVRRASPHWLIGWSRLLEGRWRDPLVGQALLAGVVFATLAPVVAVLPDAAAAMLRLGGSQPYFQSASLASAPAYASAMAWAVMNGVTNTLAFVGLIVATRFVVRNDRIVMVVTAVVATLASVSDARPFALDVVQAAITGAAVIWFMRRFGVLALAVGMSLNWIVRMTPWTFDPAAWFAWRAGLTVVLVLGVAVWGFLNAIGRQSAFPEAGLDA